MVKKNKKLDTKLRHKTQTFLEKKIKSFFILFVATCIVTEAKSTKLLNANSYDFCNFVPQTL